MGFEPTASSMPSRRAPNCATAPPNCYFTCCDSIARSYDGQFLQNITANKKWGDPFRPPRRPYSSAKCGTIRLEVNSANQLNDASARILCRVDVRVRAICVVAAHQPEAC